MPRALPAGLAPPRRRLAGPALPAGSRATVGLGERGRQVVGYVEDTGIGIAPEDVPRVFEELFRSAAAREIDEHGTGLGLSIARRIVTMCGGEIHVESAVDRGSTFTFSFPALGEGRVAMGEGVPGVAARGEDRAP